MSRKSDGKYAVLKVIDQVNNERAPFKVAEHQTDGGKEYLNETLDTELALRGVVPRNSTPHCQYQNGWIEKRMGEADKYAKAMMFRGNASEVDYPYALSHYTVA